MSTITVYHKPTCSTCRHAVQILKEEGADVDTVDYYKAPLTAAQLKDLLSKAGLSPREVLRTKEELYTGLKLGEKTLSDDELIALMVKHPDLIQRPLVRKGDRVVLARPAERVKDLL
ncbi:arsenate reductase [Nitrospira sp.]|nr:arsenate reductase [Nitrospira sp.]